MKVYSKLVYQGASITRDTSEGSVEASNWAVTIRELTKECGDEGEESGWETHQFGHWGPGWFEVILCKPGSKAAELCRGFENSLADYPVLDFEDYSMRESKFLWAKYAEFKAASMSLREKGDIITASRYEARAEHVYSVEMADWMKW